MGIDVKSITVSCCQVWRHHFDIISWSIILTSTIFQGIDWKQDDVIKWKHFPCHFVRRIHRSQVDSPHKSHWREALMFSLICVKTIIRTNTRDASDLRHFRAHYDVTVMAIWIFITLEVPVVHCDRERLVNTIESLHGHTRIWQYIPGQCLQTGLS